MEFQTSTWKIQPLWCDLRNLRMYGCFISLQLTWIFFLWHCVTWNSVHSSNNEGLPLSLSLPSLIVVHYSFFVSVFLYLMFFLKVFRKISSSEVCTVPTTEGVFFLNFCKLLRPIAPSHSERNTCGSLTDIPKALLKIRVTCLSLLLTDKVSVYVKLLEMVQGTL